MRRLVADVEHAHQAGADLRRQADALRLAAGERRRAAVERQVVEADLDQEVEAGADLLEDLVGDRLLALVERRLRRRRGRRTTACASMMLSAVVSVMFLPPTVTARDSGLSRAPSQVGQGTVAM